MKRKFFYLFTCEYCFSHYVTVFFVALTDFKLLLNDWRGYLIAGFALVWIANIYMSLFGRIRIELKRERTEVTVLEQQKLDADPENVQAEKHNASARNRSNAENGSHTVSEGDSSRRFLRHDQ